MSATETSARWRSIVIWGVVGACSVLGLGFAVTGLLGLWQFSLGRTLDAIFAFYLTVLLCTAQRRLGLGGAIAVLALLTLFSAAWAKAATLGRGPTWTDFELLPDLAAAMPLAWVALVGGWGGALVVAALLNLHRPRFRELLLSVAPLMALGLFDGPAAMTSERYEVFGHVLGFVFESESQAELARSLRMAEAGTPSARSARGDFTAMRLPDDLPRRNLHVIAVESLGDPSRLRNLAFSPPALPAVFGDVGWAVSPVFGGQTADVEFELLCGLPAGLVGSRVVFRSLTAENVDCLPRKLAAQGWRAVSSTPTTPAMFRGGEAFRRLGFAEQHWADAFDMSDRDGQWLAAEAQLKQEEARLAPLLRAGSPLFRYTMLTSGHAPFERDRSRRPDVVAASLPVAADFANAVHYSATAIEAHLRWLAEHDPEALVLVVGDHNPLLGANLDGYRQGGLISDASVVADPALYEVPLLVIDRGERLRPGHLPHYVLPQLLADRLTGGRFCQENSCSFGRDWLPRPYADRLLLINRADGKARICAAADPGECSEAADEIVGMRKALARLMR